MQHTPGPWKIGYRAMDVTADPAPPKGPMKVCDIRGWGFLTGKGHGALGLPFKEAAEIQCANAALIAAAPQMLKALRNVNKLVSEAAMTGFNCKDGDWAERLFASQAQTHAAIEEATRKYDLETLES